MKNERITEDFVRDHFKNDPLFSAIKLDEQKPPVTKAKRCLGGVDKFEPVSGGGDVNHTEEAFGELVVAGCDGAVNFQAAKEAFDVVSFPVERAVMLDLDAAV